MALAPFSSFQGGRRTHEQLSPLQSLYKQPALRGGRATPVNLFVAPQSSSFQAATVGRHSVPVFRFSHAFRNHALCPVGKGNAGGRTVSSSGFRVGAFERMPIVHALQPRRVGARGLESPRTRFASFGDEQQGPNIPGFLAPPVPRHPGLFKFFPFGELWNGGC